MRTVEVPIIENDQDLSEALAKVEALIDRDEDASAQEIRLLSMVVRAYEDEHFAIGDSTPARAIKFFMEQNGYSNGELARLLGGHSKVAEVLNGKRSLNVRMIRNLHTTWKIPLACLIESKDSVAGAA